MRRRALGIGLALLLGGYALCGWAAPVPSKAPTAWQLDIEFHDLQRLNVVLPGDQQPTSFWYLLFTVTNNTGQDVDFYPSAQLVTDALQVVTGGDDVSPSVHEAIRARHGKAYPFLREYHQAGGKLLQGSDNARTTAVVFRDFDRSASSLTLYLAGLSGEIVRLRNPAFDRNKPVSEDNAEFFLLRKTLAITYDLPGDAQTRDQATPVRRLREWVMR